MRFINAYHLKFSVDQHTRKSALPVRNGQCFIAFAIGDFDGAERALFIVISGTLPV